MSDHQHCLIGNGFTWGTSEVRVHDNGVKCLPVLRAPVQNLKADSEQRPDSPYTNSRLRSESSDGSGKDAPCVCITEVEREVCQEWTSTDSGR